VDSSIVDSSIVDSSIVDKTTEVKHDTVKVRELKPKNSKIGYQEAVFLELDEYTKLVDKFGKDDADRRIAKLSMYILSKGDKYKSHYHTILKWDNDDKEKAGFGNKKLIGHAGMRTEGGD
jgi:hypothetical protein